MECSRGHQAHSWILTVLLGADYDGRFLVLDSRRRLAAELYKPYGRRVELGLEPGRYEVYFEQERALLASQVASCGQGSPCLP